MKTCFTFWGLYPLSWEWEKSLLWTHKYMPVCPSPDPQMHPLATGGTFFLFPRCPWSCSERKAKISRRAYLRVPRCQRLTSLQRSQIHSCHHYYLWDGQDCFWSLQGSALRIEKAWFPKLFARDLTYERYFKKAKIKPPSFKDTTDKCRLNDENICAVPGLLVLDQLSYRGIHLGSVCARESGFARAAISKYHRWGRGSQNSRNLFSNNLEGRSLRRGLYPGVRFGHLLPVPPTVPLLCPGPNCLLQGPGPCWRGLPWDLIFTLLPF